jgi:aryl-alcohol dehydrogenase-like predicted oxidoreductase
VGQAEGVRGEWDLQGTGREGRAPTCAIRRAAPTVPRLPGDGRPAPVSSAVVEQRALGRSGLVVSRLALGTMTWGRDTDEDEAAMQLTAFVDAGGTLVDTADVYCDGESERTLGHLLTDVVPRADVLVATKAVGRTTSGPMGRGASRGHLLAALDASLERLGLDYVDLWQLHAWDDVTPIEETLAACDLAVSSGRARYIGISNFSGWQTAQAATWQRAWPGRTPLISTQVEYSLLQRGVEREVVPAAEALGMGVLAWSPLGRGLLTGKYRYSTPSESRGASAQWQGFIDGLRSSTTDRIVEAVITAADGLGTSPLAVALAWVRDRPGVVAPVVGARTAQQLQASLDSEGVRLPAAIRTALEDVSAPPFSYPERRQER